MADRRGNASSEGLGSRRRGRRSLIKGGAALTGGLALASVYMPPLLRSVQTVEIAYASGDPSGKGDPFDKKDRVKDKNKP